MTSATATLRGHTVGDGTVWCWDELGIDGLGTPPVRASDVPRGHADGDVPGRDTYGPRVLTLHVVSGPPQVPDMDTAWAEFELLAAAWAKVGDGVPILLDLDMFGVGYTFEGFPRGCFAATQLALSGTPVLPVQLVFVATTPDPIVGS